MAFSPPATMTAHTTPTFAPSLSNLSLNPGQGLSPSNHIDLTLDDDDNPHESFHDARSAKRARIEHFARPSSLPLGRSRTPSGAPAQLGVPPSMPGFANYTQRASMSTPMNTSPSFSSGPFPPPFVSPLQASSSSGPYRPPYAPPAPVARYAVQQQQVQQTNMTRSSSFSAFTPPLQPNPSASSSSTPQVIDLTDSPSPPPRSYNLPPQTQPKLNPKSPVCIGQLTVTSLVLYPVGYLNAEFPNSSEPEWASVKLRYEPNINKPPGNESIHLSTPPSTAPNGEVVPGETFAFVEQRVASALGPMLGKGLIRLDARVRRGLPRLPILPLQMLVYTPYGNLPVVGKYLRDLKLLLDDPSSIWDINPSQCAYINPHDPPPGGHANSANAYNSVNNVGRWSAPAVNSKSTEVQRSHAEAVFNNMRNDDDLPEADPPPDIATKLYPHQKKALTFLLEREQEIPSDNSTCSVWSRSINPISGRPYWVNLITKAETYEQPKEAKGAILADDMGLGKTITCVSLIAATLPTARAFASTPIERPPMPGLSYDDPDASHFAGAVWGMPDTNNMSAKSKAKAARDQEKLEVEYARACRIKAKSRATLIICPLSTVSNWEDQFRDHWKGEVTVFGGGGGCAALPTPSSTPGPSSSTQPSPSSSQFLELDVKPLATKPPPPKFASGSPLRVYVYHGNARRPDPAFLADFDAVITTFATLASEFSKQNRSIASADAEEEEEEGGNSDVGGMDFDEHGNDVIRLPKAKKSGKRKKPCSASTVECPSALQSIHWFRVVLDEAHSIKETGTVGSRASCDLMADRRLCLTGTPVQNKLEDVFALIKFIRFSPFDDKNMWTQFIGNPVKYSQSSGIASLQLLMKCVTLRRTKETKASDGNKIIALPPRTDELRRLQFDQQEQSIYDRFFTESKAEFNDLSSRNEVMKNYVGILQRILRLRQICDHFELVDGKFPGADGQSQECYEDIITAIARDGIDAAKAAAVFAILRESATTQCVECGAELCNANDLLQADAADDAVPSTPKRGRKPKGATSRGPTRPSSPSSPRPILTRCQHLFCIECYRNCICPGWPNVAPDIRRSCSACQAGLAPLDAVEIKPDNGADASKKKTAKREKRTKILPEDFHPSTKIKALMYDLLQFSKANPYSVNYDPASIEFEQVDKEGNKVDDGVVKTVVFSQWTSMLDKIEDALELSGIKYDRLDGTMKRDERTRAMQALKQDPACEVLLVSLKAGGVGLNLTAAQRVYLMDPYWNPAVENQAVDRIHRLGQTRPVTTVKFIIENSIEDRLLEVQRKKIELANLTLPQNMSKAERQQQRMEEVSHLLG
ncbi:hypothetical protein HGRIS_008114 [Hohenbuehelia grisea]|uniref:SNF2 family DNA-dependent ATPase n=1 Tax=Hohenbuehelia grisea TaxID=104357 RepID=A0ABR3J7D0_9AGAR